MTNLRQKLLASTLLGAASMIAMPAHAQTPPPPPVAAQPDPSDLSNDPGEAIVITGSRIQRTDLTSTSPLAVVGQEEFQLSGAVNVEQVLNTLPQVVPGITGFSNNPGNGAVTLNLRNLGSTRTLVLVNGRRWMFFNTTQVVDLNTIPQFMLEGVDVVTGGASAVYGSDAVAGVVNFRLRNDLNGVLAGANYSITERGDGARLSADLAIGATSADGRGNVTAFANYTRRDPIFQDARNFSAVAAGDGCIVAGSTNPDNGIGRNFGGALGTCVTRGGEIGLVPQGSASTPIATLPGLGGGNGSVFNPTGGGIRPFRNPEDLYNFAPDNYLQLPQERYLIGGYGSYEVDENLTVYAEVTYANNRVSQELAPTPIGQNVSLQVASPFFNAATQATLRALDTDGDGYVIQNVGYRFNSIGARNAEANRDAFRVLGGVRGNLNQNFAYDVYYSYARTRNSVLQLGNVSRSRFASSLNTEFGPGGVLQCREASARAAGCVPLNIFGQGLESAAAANYVSVDSQNTDISELKNAVATVSGNLFSLGLGADAIGVALGAEYREMSSRYIPDEFLSSGDVAGFNAGQPTQGSYNVGEFFGELRVPVLRESFIHRLEFSGAARYSKYSLDNVGGVWTYAAGGEIAPIRDVTIRGQYQRSVRAPNVEDLFAGNSTGFPAVNDPCSDRAPAAQRTEAVRALCIASGVPAANVFTRAVQPSDQIQANFGGNPNLQEETSDTYTIGAVIQPSFIPRLNVTVDYFDITVENSINVLAGGASQALSLCYTVVQDINNPVCSVFVGNRSSTGALGQTQGGGNPSFLSANIGELSTRGIDVQVDYTQPLGFSLFGGEESQLNFFYLGTYLDRFRQVSVAAIPERESIGENSIITNPLPRYRHTARVSYADGPGVVSLRWRYFGPVRDPRIINNFVGLERVPIDPSTFPNARISPVNYFDLSFAFDATDNLQVNLGVNNLFDKLPETLGAGVAEQANTYPGTYDVLGRDFFVSARLRF